MTLYILIGAAWFHVAYSGVSHAPNLDR